MKEDNLNKNNDFKIPEGYFDHLEDRLMDKIENDHSLNLNKNTGFKSPDGYFESIEDKVFAKINEKKTKIKVFSLYNKKTLITISAIAASLLLFFSIQSINNNDELNFNALDLADINAYIEQGNIDLSDTELVNLIGEEIDFTESFEDNPIDDEAVMDYLNNNDIENEIIYFD